jgi:hypothetical protein
MGKRHPNPRRVKSLRLYTIGELALAFGLHKNTVRKWPKLGLKPIDNRRPALFRGVDVSAFLRAQRTNTRRPCGPGELYCLKCRTPKIPDGNIADLTITAPTSGCLIGICPTCGTMLYRRVNPSRIASVRGVLEITVTKPKAHIEELDQPNLKCNFKGRD